MTCRRLRTTSSSTTSATPPRRARRTAIPTWSNRITATPVAVTTASHIKTCSRCRRQAVRPAVCSSNTRCISETPWPRAWTPRVTACARSRPCSRKAWRTWVILIAIAAFHENLFSRCNIASLSHLDFFSFFFITAVYNYFLFL